MELPVLAQQILFPLENAAAIIVVIIILFSIKRFRSMLSANSSITDKILVGSVFGLLAIFGTLTSKQIDGALLNVRDLSPIVAGILGGPIVGITAGLIGGLQRFSMGGFTAVPCSLATVIAGTLAGLLSTKITGKYLILFAAVLAACLELLHMGLILLLAQPTENAIMLVEKIALPMMVANAIGVACGLYLINRK